MNWKTVLRAFEIFILISLVTVTALWLIGFPFSFLEGTPFGGTCDPFNLSYEICISDPHSCTDFTALCIMANQIYIRAIISHVLLLLFFYVIRKLA